MNAIQKLKTLLFDEERAVSPVIGVILMVAITVILAAVIGTFVLDLGQNTGQAAPQASISVSTNSTDVTLSHKGGDALADDQTRIQLSGAGASVSDTIANLAPKGDWDDAGSATQWQVGEDVIITPSTLNSGETLNVKVVDVQTNKIIYETDVTVP